MRLSLLLVLLALGGAAAAQPVPVGSCEKGRARATLETDTVRLGLWNQGRLFYGLGESVTEWGQYLVPKSSGTYPAEIVNLWVSAVVGDSLRTTIADTYESDFWPGPLADADAPPAACAEHDRMWTVSRADLDRYVATGQATTDLAEWPHDLGAPVLDGDGIPDNYDLAAGDQPDLLGDAAVWWVMNDAGNQHGYRNQPGTAPIGVEVRVHAFAFEQSPFPTVPDTPLQEATFYRYEFVNRRDVPLDSVYVSLAALGRTGALGNDFQGTDTLSHVAYIYNATEHEDAYSDRPAAWGMQVLRGPVGLANRRDDDRDGETDEPGERLRLTSSPPAFFLDGPRYPRSPREWVNVQQGLFPRGGAIYASGIGEYCWPGCPDCSSGCSGWEPTRYAFPADPTVGEFWSETNRTGEPTTGGGYYREVLASVGPFRIEPGATAEILYAMPFARTDDHLRSVTALRGVARGLLAAFGDGVPSRRVDGPPAPPLPVAQGVRPVRPNPGVGGQSAVLDLPEATHVDADVLDLLGRVVAVVAGGTLQAGETDLAVPDGLPPGLYLLRVSAAQGRPVALRFTVVAR
ncbi:T9SS type A sorting domain-containing protein [Rubrivirga sp. IMCC43871]|uniref:T9SS type A sorting domain-containing protein n=1 Tax=Rubrivirga sp. IMCC43871 TaxID=3391575 RepID=UPI00398FFAF0